MKKIRKLYKTLIKIINLTSKINLINQTILLVQIVMDQIKKNVIKKKIFGKIILL